MTDVKVFNSPMFGELRTSRSVSNEPLFCLSDVCKVLELQSGATKNRLDEKGISLINTLTDGGSQSMVYISEPNHYRCIFQSRKPTARKFQDWVFYEVIPSIRKTGGYIVEKRDDTPEDIMARAVLVAQQTLARREQRIKELEEHGREQDAAIERKDTQIKLQTEQIRKAAPKAEYYDKTLASTDCITTTQVADDLGISAKTLNQKLEENRVIYRQSGQWHLTARFKSWKLHGTRTYSYTKENGTVGSKTTLVWNQRGKRFILALYNNNFNLRQAIAEIKGEL